MLEPPRSPSQALDRPPRQAATVAAAYDALDAIADKLQHDGAPDGYLEVYVVDADRNPVTRPGLE